MSVIAALKGYRTQFLYSLHVILSNVGTDQVFRLEGEEDIDVLDANHNLLCAIQLKNLGRSITLSDIISNKKTSFIKRFLEEYSEATPILVSYGEISENLKSWKISPEKISDKEKNILKKYQISQDDWKSVKTKTEFIEVNEAIIAKEVQSMLKSNFPLVDPIPTIGLLLNWLQLIAEKQKLISRKVFFSKVEDFGLYLSDRIALHEQYGTILNPLHKITKEDSDPSKLKKEFYNATSTKYEHIQLGLEVDRNNYLDQIDSLLKENNVVIVKGASGQGKTTLLYSYIHNYRNESLTFELNVQNDPITTQKSIKSVSSICKKLEIPVVFVINVNPNNTEWLQIVKKSSHYVNIQFLIAIRNEDWYRATSIGVEFEHKEIDLTLSREEAEIIYSQLNEVNKVSHFTDFDESWIQIGESTPLLEFVYSITQGDSLINKLKQQVQQILKEGGMTDNSQVEFLRIVSLADSFGAKIDVSKLDSINDYQFIIEKLENEYLIKSSLDKKCITGLHLVRSQKLSEILFDEFSNHREHYGLKCIPLIAEEDLYLFLIQLFHGEIFDSQRFLSEISKVQVSNWSTYASIIKSLLWLGTYDYVNSNRSVIDEIRAKVGDSWIVFTDFMFSSQFKKDELLDLLSFNQDLRDQLNQINQRVSSNSDVFVLLSKAVKLLSLPQNIPVSNFEWKSFGETLFWLRNIEDEVKYECTFLDLNFDEVFRKLDSSSLSKLMLGMHSYSVSLNNIRIKHQDHFVDRMKYEFDISHIDVKEEAVSVHYIVDLLNSETKRQTNDFVVHILNILRTGFPDKNKFTIQGHGHRLKNLSMDFDNTHKSISIENLPLEEWTKINSCIIKLYDYEYRPIDWNEYCEKLKQWEISINEKVDEFTGGFKEVFRGSTTYSPVIPVMQNALYKNESKIKEPKSITDPLGIYSKTKSLANDKNEEKNLKLTNKFEAFFKSLSGFKSNIEFFLTQSGKTLQSRIQIKTEENHIHDQNIERLSQVNLYSAIEKLQEFNGLYKSILGNLDQKHSDCVSVNSLIAVASIWKDFLNNETKGDHSGRRILKLKTDFETRIVKACKKISKNNDFSIKYMNNTLDGTPILLIDGQNPFWSLVGMKDAYSIVKRAISSPESTSIKSLMLRLGFRKFFFIQTVANKTLNNQHYEFPLFKISDTSFEDLEQIYLLPKPISYKTITELKLQSWSNLYPEFDEINNVSEAYSRMVIMVNHFYDLREFDEIEFIEQDQIRLDDKIKCIGIEIQKHFQTVLDSLVGWMELFPIDEDEFLMSEEEQLFYRSIIGVQENLFPTEKDDEENFRIELNMEVIEGWIDRLAICNEHWTIFILLLQGKYISRLK